MFEEQFISCKYGMLEDTEDKKVVTCHNHRCPDRYCLYGYFTGGQIPDSVCEYFDPKSKSKKKEYHI